MMESTQSSQNTAGNQQQVRPNDKVECFFMFLLTFPAL